MIELKKEDLRERLKDAGVQFLTDEELEKEWAEQYNGQAKRHIRKEVEKIKWSKMFLENIALETGVDISIVKTLYGRLITDPYSALWNTVTDDQSIQLEETKQWYKDKVRENRELKRENKRLEEELRSK